MRKDIGILYIVFRDIIMLATFMLALSLEHARSERFYTMVMLFAVFFVWLNLREVFKNRFDKLLPYSFAVDILLLVQLDENSRYLVNYYFNVYYFYVLIAAGFMLKKNSRLVVSLVVVLSAFLKYRKVLESLYIEPKPANISFVVSYIFFTLMVFVTVAVFFNYSRILSEEKAKLDRLNIELTNANLLLEEKNRRIKELVIFEERNRIAREIHDSVGHGLTGLIMNLDFCEKLAGVDSLKVKEQVSKCRGIAKDCLSDIRSSVKALKPASAEKLTLLNSLEELRDNTKKKFSIDLVIETYGEFYTTRPEFNAAVYRVCQEAVTNSVRHGQASNINIQISFGQKEFGLLIKDNGKGVKEIKEGTGLTGMTERIKAFNGSIGFYENDGFMIKIIVPSEGIING